jgi:hypothetical protein
MIIVEEIELAMADVADLPPLTDEQCSKIAVLLGLGTGRRR